MTLLDAINSRHSVRAYKDQPVPAELRAQLDGFAAELNRESGLNIRIVYDDPAGFDSMLARYGRFRGVNNYIVLAGPDSPDFAYRCGWYGEALVLFAQQLGLNTCWTAATFNKKHVKKLVPEGEKLCMAIALGFGETQGVPHKGKTVKDVVRGDLPERFLPAVEAALKAPTAMNQQKFVIVADGAEDGRPAVIASGRGAYVQVDLGIVSYHFNALQGLSEPYRGI
jgi:nitroreductase